MLKILLIISNTFGFIKTQVLSVNAFGRPRGYHALKVCFFYNTKLNEVPWGSGNVNVCVLAGRKVMVESVGKSVPWRNRDAWVG